MPIIDAHKKASHSNSEREKINDEENKERHWQKQDEKFMRV